MATASNVSSEVCSICTEKFRDPKLLPCFHTFCLECLQKSVSSSSKDGQFPCPLCRYQVTLPEKGVAGFQTNFYIAARAEKQVHGGGECCGVCEQQATHSCRECEILLCESCTKCHQTLPSTRFHMLINLGESGAGIPLLSIQKFCEKHNEEKLRFFCMPCGKVICRDCKLTNHEGHKTKDISDVVKQARTSLTKTKVKLEKYKKETDETYQQIKHTSNEISINIEHTQRELNTLSKSLMKSPENVINKLADIEEVNKETFSKESCPLIERQRFLQGQIDYAGAILEEGLDSDVITTDDEMKGRLKLRRDIWLHYIATMNCQKFHISDL
ncbi:E3 ubiquitin-protein ligase TRIM56-like [Gigantopelta aegis]|uniref:E3 ubiquitin-protein ligase TRIM56-like n=1 Tax=Gigantopelta aegis TaxID=1735272 RepID=UPI001B889E37|nr:E3 ubiquitin-protein ligase TRIM56-like [Gigantopelta aegis]